MKTTSSRSLGFLVILTSSLLLNACSNPSQFRANEVALERVELSNQKLNRDQSAKPGDIIRESGQIQFHDLKAKWNDDDLAVTGQLNIQGKSVGPIEFKGQKEGNEVVLISDDSRIGKQIRVKAICLSEDSACGDFFMDAFFKDDRGVIQHDQFVIKEKAVQPKLKSLSESISFKPGSVSSTKVGRDQSEKIKEVIIPDDVEVKSQGAYAGATDQEAKDLFDEANPKLKIKSTSVQKTNTTTTTTLKSSKAVEVKAAPPTKPSEQAIGSPNKGRLESATNLALLAKGQNSFFRLIWPGNKTGFATRDMAGIIQKLGEFIHQKVAGYILTVGDISSQHGGKLFSHLSHQNGLDADIAYVVSNERSNFKDLTTWTGVSSDFMPAENWALFKKAFAVGKVELILVDKKIKKSICQEAIRSKDLNGPEDRGPAFQILRRLKHVEHHDNHFHLRIACPVNDRRCRQPEYSLGDSGCY